MRDAALWRRVIRLAWDWLSWVFATLAVLGSRYDFQLSDVLWTHVIHYIVAACALQLIIGTIFMLYRGRYRNATFEESFGLAATIGLVGALLGTYFIGVVEVGSFPRATAVLTPPVALLTMATGRWLYRAWKERVDVGQDAEACLIYGAGDAGYQLLRLIVQQHQSPYRVVGFLDDAKGKRNLRLLGIPVLGGLPKLEEIAAQRAVATVILAISDADSDLIRRVSTSVEGAGLRLLVLPAVQDLMDGRVQLSDVREVDIADILGRHQIHTDVAGIAGYLTNRVVLVTGAGGSIGSELARQIHRYGPRELVLLDRDESGLHGVQVSIYKRALLDTPDMVLCDIRDAQAVDEVFARHQPEVVFHAAALKHLPMLEQYPQEGWKTNVLGTLNVLRAAGRHGCSSFVNVSTDKAADPISVLGKTKRLAERLTAWHADALGASYLSVRFGNVLGSRGSVLHTFNCQIQSGGPLTVTHPDITRFFMTVPEACELTIQAAAIGQGGEVLVLDMGEPVKILDVAERLVAKSGKQVDIVFTGLRQGEKMHEALLSVDEIARDNRHPQIWHVDVPPLDPEQVSVAHELLDPDRVPT